MVYKPGQSGNPAGRAPRGKVIGRLLPEDFKTCNDINGLDLVATVALHPKATLQMRLSAGSILAQYQSIKPGDRIGRDLRLPEPTDVETARQNIARIATEAAGDRLPPDLASKLIDHQQAYITAHIDHEVEARLAALEEAAERNPPRVAAVIVGGLPVMPGHEQVILPPREILLPKGDEEGER